mmetsp:Transcript_6200/g.10057  ORF Transcript_6200/g.10057 Transcript_6200/m.10057 type:complete len:250 (+) Transcript_6200:566-1315(+)
MVAPSKNYKTSEVPQDEMAPSRDSPEDKEMKKEEAAASSHPVKDPPKRLTRQSMRSLGINLSKGEGEGEKSKEPLRIDRERTSAPPQIVEFKQPKVFREPASAQVPVHYALRSSGAASRPRTRKTSPKVASSSAVTRSMGRTDNPESLKDQESARGSVRGSARGSVRDSSMSEVRAPSSKAFVTSRQPTSRISKISKAEDASVGEPPSSRRLRNGKEVDLKEKVVIDLTQEEPVPENPESLEKPENLQN